jgi:hypothetical protein
MYIVKHIFLSALKPVISGLRKKDELIFKRALKKRSVKIIYHKKRKMQITSLKHLKSNFHITNLLYKPSIFPQRSMPEQNNLWVLRVHHRQIFQICDLYKHPADDP